MKYLYLLLFANLIFSQTTKVVYQLDTNFNEKQLKDEYIGEYLRNIKEAAYNVEFELIYNDTIGNFSVIEKNVVDENYKKAVEFSGGSSKSYYHKNTFYKYTGDSRVFKNNEFLVENNLESNWKITQETLMVNGYKCFKAIALVEVKHEGKTFKHDKTVWFCPEISAKYGPNGNGGLPGLIMFFEESGIIFKMKSINFEDNSVIEMPVKKNVIDNTEYIKKIEDNAKKEFRD
jgi:GLPGLI family protein